MLILLLACADPTPTTCVDAVTVDIHGVINGPCYDTGYADCCPDGLVPWSISAGQLLCVTDEH